MSSDERKQRMRQRVNACRLSFYPHLCRYYVRNTTMYVHDKQFLPSMDCHFYVYFNKHRKYHSHERRNSSSLIARFMGPIWVPPGADTRCDPCGPREHCYLGYLLSPYLKPFLYSWLIPKPGREWIPLALCKKRLTLKQLVTIFKM